MIAIRVFGTPDGIKVWILSDGMYVVANESGWLDGEFTSVEDAVKYAESIGDNA